MQESPELLNNQAIQLASHGDFAEAIACFKCAITIQGENHLLWYNLGMTYKDSGDLKQAQNALEHALTLAPYDEEIIESLAALNFSMGHIEEAMEYCGLGLHLNMNNPHLWNTIGVLYFNCNEYEDASEAFEHAVSINPYYYDALFNLRDTYEQLGNTAGKIECENRMRDIKK